MLSKRWSLKTSALSLAVIGIVTFPLLTNITVFAQTPSTQLPTAQCTEMEIQKHIQQLNKAEPSDFDALVACQSKAVPALIQALDTQDENIRIIIIAALGQIGSQASLAVPLLNELLVKDTSSDVRSMTVHALKQIDKDPILVLITDLKNEDWRVRYRAANALGQIGAEAKEAIPALTIALKDEAMYVRSSAKQALKKIRSSTNGEIIRGGAAYSSSSTDQSSSDTVSQVTRSQMKANPPVMCKIPAIRTILKWKCP